MRLLLSVRLVSPLHRWKTTSDISYKQPCECYCTEIGRLRHIVKKGVTALSFTSRLVIRISHDEEEASRSLQTSINSMSPSLVHFIGIFKRGGEGEIYVTDLCQIVKGSDALCSQIFLNDDKHPRLVSGCQMMPVLLYQTMKITL